MFPWTTTAAPAQAPGILTSSKLVDALDVSREDPRVVELYGPANVSFVADGAPRVTTNFLVARRLVEAGIRYVTFNFSRWDWHGNNFRRARQNVPLLDQALTALVSDLHERGLDPDVSVVCWGEFGRTPKINDKAGRDHWPKANFAILAGGGMKSGQFIGSTDGQAAEPTDRPVNFHEVFATLFHNIGLLDAPAPASADRRSPKGSSLFASWCSLLTLPTTPADLKRCVSRPRCLPPRLSERSDGTLLPRPLRLRFAVAMPATTDASTSPTRY